MHEPYVMPDGEAIVCAHDIREIRIEKKGAGNMSCIVFDTYWKQPYWTSKGMSREDAEVLLTAINKNINLVL